MAKGFCIECDTPIKLGNSPVKGTHVTCPKCGAYLKVISISPIELDWVYESEMESEQEIKQDQFEDFDWT
jgi:lysine biosynthesis protein LysW